MLPLIREGERSMYKHILIPTDGSELSGKAVTQGLALAKALGAKATVMTSTPVWSATEMTSQSYRQPHPIEEYERRHADWAEQVLAAAKAGADKAGVPCETLHVSDREPDEAIVATAEKRGCDLIVMASHGRGRVGRLLLGSVAVKVLTYTKIPVQIIR
jgi:nucleotide-binding universal stress UspA family protein